MPTFNISTLLNLKQNQYNIRVCHIIDSKPVVSSQIVLLILYYLIQRL